MPASFDDCPQVGTTDPNAVTIAEHRSGRPAFQSVRTTASWLGRLVASAVGTVFSLAMLVVGLAIVATIPIVQFLALGYLLEAGARMARPDRQGEILPGLDRFGRLGRIAAAIAVAYLAWRTLNGFAIDAQVIAADSQAAKTLSRVAAATGVVLVFHCVLAAIRGRLIFFFRPFNNLVWLARSVCHRRSLLLARHRAAEWIGGMRLPHYFSLGLRGFCGAAFWLFIPATMLALGKDRPLLGLSGGILLAIVACWLPFLQIRFAVENRFDAMFEIREIRSSFRRAPLAYLTTVITVLTLALPLYLLKIEQVPKDAEWLLAIAFVVTILPAKLVAGWSCRRSSRRQSERWLPIVWAARVAMVPFAVIYAYVVFLTQYIGWHGALALYEQHAFLLPVPF